MSLANLVLGPKLITISSGVTISPASIEHEFLENAAFIVKKPCGCSDHAVLPQRVLPLTALPLISRPLINAGKLARARALSGERFIER
jgi:hypothetical protein